jgi:hypothetical protein
MPVANCPKCNKVFQRTVNPLCPTCHQETLSNVSVVYRFVQEHPQQTLEQIAKHCNLTAKELETLKRKGHFCPECAVKLEPKNATAEVSERKAPKTARTRPAIPSPEEIIEEEVAETFAEPPQKHESVSPLLDSYGFKRASEK